MHTARARKQKGVEPVEYAAVSRQQLAAVFHAGPAFQRRLGKIAQLSGDVQRQGRRGRFRRTQVARQENVGVHDSGERRKDDRADRSFPCFVRAEARRQRAFSERLARIERRYVAGGVDDQNEQQPVGVDAMHEPPPEQRRRNVNDAGQSNRRRGQRFCQAAAPAETAASRARVKTVSSRLRSNCGKSAVSTPAA